MTEGFDPVALPPDRTPLWLILGTLVALAILTWAAWAEMRPERDPLPLRPTVHGNWIPAPLHQERALAKLEQPGNRP